MKKRARKTPKKATKMTTTKLMFLSFMLLFIIVEALFIVKAQLNPPTSQVAGASTSR